MSQAQSGHLEGDARVTEESSARGADTFGVRSLLLLLVALVPTPHPDVTLAHTHRARSLTPPYSPLQTLNQHPALEHTGEIRVGVSIDRNRRCRRSMEECVPPPSLSPS